MRSGASSAHLSRRHFRWQRTLAAVVAVAAVVVALFTMQSMAGSLAHREAGSSTVAQAAGGDDHAGSANPAVAAAGDAERHVDAMLAVACDEACQIGCLMVGLICTLGLLAVLLAFVLPPVAAALIDIRGQGHRILRGVIAAVAAPRPPSLTALSISRT